MAKAKGKGWHGDSKGHAKAAKGENPRSESSSSKEQGWHGDSEGHARAAKGKSKEPGLLDKILKKD